MSVPRAGLALVLGTCLSALPACPDPPTPPPGALTIGTRDGTQFVPLAERDAVAVVLGANGLNMIVPSLRAQGIDPRAPDPTVLVEIGEIVLGADIEGSRVDMSADGDGYVLWDLRVPFQSELCCYNCKETRVSARIADSSGRVFEGALNLVPQRGGCPDVSVCCANANDCPDPALTQLCR